MRQHSTVRVHKLTDIVLSLWLEISKLLKELVNVLYVWKPFNNIIIGINELYVCKYLLDLDLTLMNILEGQLLLGE